MSMLFHWNWKRWLLFFNIYIPFLLLLNIGINKIEHLDPIIFAILDIPSVHYETLIFAFPWIPYAEEYNSCSKSLANTTKRFVNLYGHSERGGTCNFVTIFSSLLAFICARKIVQIRKLCWLAESFTVMLFSRVFYLKQ